MVAVECWHRSHRSACHGSRLRASFHLKVCPGQSPKTSDAWAIWHEIAVKSPQQGQQGQHELASTDECCWCAGGLLCLLLAPCCCCCCCAAVLLSPNQRSTLAESTDRPPGSTRLHQGSTHLHHCHQTIARPSSDTRNNPGHPGILESWNPGPEKCLIPGRPPSPVP